LQALELSPQTPFSYPTPYGKQSVKKTISLPSELARELEEQARAERKTLSGVIQEALWSRRAKEKGILSERDLERYLSQ
jgi:hypothetical protein